MNQVEPNPLYTVVIVGKNLFWDFGNTFYEACIYNAL